MLKKNNSKVLSQMNVLYVGPEIIKNKSGADQINTRNRLLLKTYFGEDFYELLFKSHSKFETLINLFFCCLQGLSVSRISKAKNKVKSLNINCVFLTNSKYGLLSFILRKFFPDLRIIVFFHNIEKQYYQEEMKSRKNIYLWFVSRIVALNESLSVKYANECWVLNTRDENLLNSIYGKHSSLILPTSLRDSFNKQKKDIVDKNNKSFTLLFVGVNFFANVDGIRWFVEKVMPMLDCRLIIVGKGMEKEKLNGYNNVEVNSYVSDLDYYYYMCDAVVLPIFSGGGMKTKTAEAMMYGCPVIGTREAFEGYEIEYSMIGGICNTESEFATLIASLQHNKEMRENCAANARSLFVKEYSFDASYNKIESYFRQK